MRLTPSSSLLALSCLLLVAQGCSHIAHQPHAPSDAAVLSKDDQAALTPQQVLSRLQEGNAEYAAGDLDVRNNPERIHAASSGQYPMAAVLSCMDSRVPVEDVFNCGIGDLFVLRIGGNVVNEEMLGSLEYACHVAGAKLILVLGHESCGAVTAAIQGPGTDNMTGLLAKIHPAVQETAQHFDGLRSSTNPDFVDAVCDENIRQAIQSIRQNSPLLRKMEQDGSILIVGGNYRLETGVVDFSSYSYAGKETPERRRGHLRSRKSSPTPSDSKPVYYP